METDPGVVYHSPAAGREWQPDQDVGGFNHMLFDDGRSMAGIWRADPEANGGPVSVPIPARETIVVLAGSVSVTVAGGEARRLAVGDMLSIPAGSMVGWDPAPDCSVFWIYS